MNILLAAVNAKYIHSNPAVYDLKAYADVFFESQKSDNSNLSINIAEYTINSRTEKCLSDIYSKRPDVIAFSCYIWNWSFIKSLLFDIKKVLPDTIIWLGGPEASFRPEEILTEYPMVDAIMIGEGEKTFRELCSFFSDLEKGYIPSQVGSIELSGFHESFGTNGLSDNPDLSCIPGLCIRKDNKPYFTGINTPVDIDDIPFWYNDLSCFKNRIIYYESSRGCPFGCSYCLSSVDTSVRYKDLRLVKKDLGFFLDNSVPQVKFIDRTFNLSHERTEEIWKFIIDNDNGITNFHFEIAADLITDSEIELLSKMRPGLVQLEIGVQSFNKQTLEAVHRKTDLKILQERVSKIREGKNVHMHLDLIAGLPYEDMASFKSSFNSVFAMEPDQLQLGFLKVLKGSPMESHTGEFEIAYTKEPPYEVLSSKWMTYEDILKLKAVEEVLEIFYNSQQFSNTINYLLKYYNSPFDLFENLSNYFKERGYDLNTPSRMDRINFLFDFAVNTCPGDTDTIKEILTFDAYLRENCKSRPMFSSDLSTYNSFIHPIQKGRKVHVDVFNYSVWDSHIVKLSDPIFVEFDYEIRSPIDNNCRINILDIDIQK